ncbi:hypothetical protein G6F62_005784 [Rhizopus arrhizus]|nr:hypothetical protein G6F23_006958 [Rhizopus arrhizus]KAG1285820.1 hypothetical protein G6F66_010320 [Rhizopus arrhizus]KAG1339413.1 hypothetical protein G6F62_005784 [Rhizopus arrhizus]
MSNTNSTDSSPAGIIVHKPDERPSERPPPPYTKEPRTSDTADYGSIHDEQTGLLTPSTAKQLHPQDPEDADPDPLPLPDRASTGANSSQNRKRWFPLLLVLCFISINIYLFGDWADPSAPERCQGQTAWADLPDRIRFGKKMEIVLDGQVSGGQLRVTPVEQGGYVKSMIMAPASLQKDMSFELQEDEEEVKLTLFMPKTDPGCIQAQLEIALPHDATRLAITFANVAIQVDPLQDLETLYIRNRNGDIALGAWSGRSLWLINANGQITASDTLTGRDWVSVENANGGIELLAVEVKDRIRLKTSSGHVRVLGSLVADDQVTVQATNGPLLLSGRTMADRVYVQNANGPIELSEVVAKEQVVLKTSNAPIRASVAGEKKNQVLVSTSNDLIDLHMTDEFEGHFVFSTSSSNGIQVAKDDSMHYTQDAGYIKRGYRHKSDDKGDLQVITSNGDIHVAFDIPS